MRYLYCLNFSHDTFYSENFINNEGEKKPQTFLKVTVKVAADLVIFYN